MSDLNQGATEQAAPVVGHPGIYRPKRVQLSRQRGAKLPSNTVKVDRSTMWGNPYRVREAINMRMVRRWGWEISPQGRKVVCDDATEAVRRFCHALQWDEAIHDHVRKELGGRNLACWCGVDQPCHADVLLMIANAEPGEISAANAAFDDALLRSASAV